MACVVAPGEADSSHEIHYGDGAVLRCPLGSTAFIDARFGGAMSKSTITKPFYQIFYLQKGLRPADPSREGAGPQDQRGLCYIPFSQVVWLQVDFKFQMSF